MVWTKWTILAPLTLTAAVALAQPLKIQDRHPAYAGDPVAETKRVRVELIHSFEERWEPVYELLRQQRRRGK